ncbi:Processing peptidase [Giardia muris]|uniref:Processing peptidase n=1 Tax=Giardia muris TaxID=5742 RepID=A0A4Z1SNX3_GIAMU|nr:Processing peptidase [Giardia muris]|eukprot:TNJ27524.1 Processing peptidase [Giardia muris]
MTVIDAFPGSRAGLARTYIGGPLGETRLQGGFTHLLEHLAFGQGASRTSLFNTAAQHEVNLNGYTSNSFVAFTAEGPSLDRCKAVLDRLSLHPDHSSLAIRQECDEIAVEHRAVTNTRYETIKEKALAVAFGMQPIGGSIISMTGLHERATPEALNKFKSALFSPDNELIFLTEPLCMPGDAPFLLAKHASPFYKYQHIDMTKFNGEVYTTPGLTSETLIAFPVASGVQTDAALILCRLLSKVVQPGVDLSVLPLPGASIFLCAGPTEHPMFEDVQSGLRRYQRVSPHTVRRTALEVRHELVSPGPGRQLALITAQMADHEILRLNTISPQSVETMIEGLGDEVRALARVFLKRYFILKTTGTGEGNGRATTL